MTITVLSSSPTLPKDPDYRPYYMPSNLLTEEEERFSERDTGGLIDAMFLGALNLILVSLLYAQLQTNPIFLAGDGWYGLVGKVLCNIIISYCIL